tara:strand:+ start:389 stop:595 length:207 start_codon:yes stop_codon:yes gene_type:complete
MNHERNEKQMTQLRNALRPLKTKHLITLQKSTIGSLGLLTQQWLIVRYVEQLQQINLELKSREEKKAA